MVKEATGGNEVKDKNGPKIGLTISVKIELKIKLTSTLIYFDLKYPS